MDFNGGLGGFLASLVEAGVAVDFTGTTVQRGTNGKVLVNVTVEDADSIPSHINLFAHGARVTETADGATIQFTFNSNMAAVGYKNLMSSTAISGTNRHDVSGESNGRDLWIAADNRNYNFTDIGTHTIRVGDAEIESSDDILIAGGGNDSIQAGTGWDWISGGAGNDTLHGGDQDDTIFGGAGNDLIFGGHQMDYLEGGAGADTIYGTAQGDSARRWMHDPPSSQSRPRFGCFAGTVRRAIDSLDRLLRSCRQIRSTRLSLTTQPAGLRRSSAILR